MRKTCKKCKYTTFHFADYTKRTKRLNSVARCIGVTVNQICSTCRTVNGEMKFSKDEWITLANVLQRRDLIPREWGSIMATQDKKGG